MGQKSGFTYNWEPGSIELTVNSVSIAVISAVLWVRGLAEVAIESAKAERLANPKPENRQTGLVEARDRTVPSPTDTAPATQPHSPPFDLVFRHPL